MTRATIARTTHFVDVEMSTLGVSGFGLGLGLGLGLFGFDCVDAFTLELELELNTTFVGERKTVTSASGT
jgi:hypothetical protein